MLMLFLVQEKYDFIDFAKKWKNRRRITILPILQQFVQQINQQCISILLLKHVWSKTEEKFLVKSAEIQYQEKFEAIY